MLGIYVVNENSLVFGASRAYTTARLHVEEMSKKLDLKGLRQQRSNKSEESNTSNNASNSSE